MEADALVIKMKRDRKKKLLQKEKEGTEVTRTGYKVREGVKVYKGGDAAQKI